MIRETKPPSALDELATLRAEVARLREAERRCRRLSVIRELGDAVLPRDAFIAIAGHELRNPMGAILLAVTNMAHVATQLREKGEALPEWIPSRLGALERQARTFVRRATTLLDVSRITSGHLRLEPEIVDLSEVTRGALDLLGAELERAQSPLTTSIEDSVCGWWDRVALDQVLTNLISNAIKYGAGKPIRESRLEVERESTPPSPSPTRGSGSPKPTARASSPASSAR